MVAFSSLLLGTPVRPCPPLPGRFCVGVIAVLADGETNLIEAIAFLRASGEPKAALRLPRRKQPDDTATAFAWTSAARHARICLAIRLRSQIVEEIFALPILSPGEGQRLLDIGGACLVLPDAKKSLIVIE